MLAETPTTDVAEQLRAASLQEYLPKAVALIQSVNEAGNEVLAADGVHELPTTGEFAETLAYAMALADAEKKQKALSAVVSREQMNDRCAALGVYMQRVAMKSSNNQVTAAITTAEEVVADLSKNVPSQYGVKHKLQQLQKEVVALIESVS